MARGIQNRLGSSFSVTFPDFPSFTITPHDIHITQEMGKQDVIELMYPRFSDFFLKSLKTGVPIYVTWKNDNSSGKFFGYVYSVLPTIQQSLKAPVLIRGIGTSMSLKEGGPLIWRNKTASEIVTDICKIFKLKAVVTPTSQRFSQQSMVGQTYWEKIQELAKRSGCVAQMNGNELHFHPIDVMINKFITTVPVMAYSEPYTGAFVEVLTPTLDKFRATVGDYFDSSSYSKKEKTLYGIDPITSKFYSATSSPNEVGTTLRNTTKDPLFGEILPGAISGNKATAQIIAKAHAQLSRFSMHAEGIGQGTPLMSPYRTIQIEGTGETTDGYWIVKKVTHAIAYDGRYQVEFSCMTDGTNGNKGSQFRPSVVAGVPVRNIASELANPTSKPTSTKISAPTTMVKQTDAGFKVTPRRWVSN